jgi:hypothetical protein
LTAASAEWQSAAADFHVAARETGYLSPAEFMAFLNRSTQGNAPLAEDPLGRLKQLGGLATLLLVLIGGLGLNLTPCVLPLIPINLAIIGAGRTARSRREGLLHGTAYGLGMSLTYGTLGLAVVLTGAKFGTVNSSPLVQPRDRPHLLLSWRWPCSMSGTSISTASIVCWAAGNPCSRGNPAASPWWPFRSGPWPPCWPARAWPRW